MLLRPSVHDALGGIGKKSLEALYLGEMRSLALKATASAGATMTELTRAIANIDGLISRIERELNDDFERSRTCMDRSTATRRQIDGLALLAAARLGRDELQKALDVVAGGAGIAGTA